MDALSLDQFAVFAAVVEEGSFAAAARRLNRAQSAITYTIQKLEEQSGTALFDRSAYRPVLTEAGKALLPRARRILVELEEYRLHARRMVMGLEDELTLSVHPYTPPNLLSQGLGEFSRMFPSVQLTVYLEAVDAAAETLETGKADLALMLDLEPWGTRFERSTCLQIEFVTIAASGHPLAQIDGVLTPEQLRPHMQLITHGCLSEESFARAYATDTINAWRVMDLDIKHRLLLAGVGWGAMPVPTVESDIAAGRLVPMRLEGWNDRQLLAIPLVIAYARNKPLGPAGRWLYQQFSASADSSAPTDANVGSPAMEVL